MNPQKTESLAQEYWKHHEMLFSVLGVVGVTQKDRPAVGHAHLKHLI